jgi:N-methylhydantoinase A
LRAEFDKQHEKMFGHTAPDEAVEIISYRLRGIGKVPPVSLREYAPEGISFEKALRETRTARFDGKSLDCPVYQREKIDVGISVSGPAIIDQLDCTSVIPPGHRARVDKFKNLILTREQD